MFGEGLRPRRNARPKVSISANNRRSAQGRKVRSPSVAPKGGVGDPRPTVGSRRRRGQEVGKVQKQVTPRGVAGVDARRATPPDLRLPRRGLTGCRQLDPSHPALVTCEDANVESCQHTHAQRKRKITFRKKIKIKSKSKIKTTVVTPGTKSYSFSYSCS